MREKLRRLADLLRTQGDDVRADWVEEALSGSDEAIDACLVSDNLWGGPGSIADEGGLRDSRGHDDGRKQIQGLLIEIGNEQIRMGKVNIRTKSWVEAFTKWRAMGL
jgi:hypothetical protein